MCCVIFLVVSVGLSILFNLSCILRWTDIVAKIMNKYLHMDGSGRNVFIGDVCCTRHFRFDKKTVVLSILGTYFNGIVLDHFIF